MSRRMLRTQFSNKKLMKKLKRIGFSTATPLYLLFIWWKAFDGAYTQSDVLWITAISISLAIGLYLYLPIAKKVKTFSLIWFIFLGATIFFVSEGLIGIGFDGVDIDEEFFPISFRAWGEFKLYFGLWIPVIYLGSKFHNRPNKWSQSAFFERIRLDEQEKSDSTF